jgi:hypothetical protein
VNVLITDLEGTLTSEMNTWYALNQKFGVDEKTDSELYNNFIDGKITHEEWTSLLVKEWKSKNECLSRDYFIKFFKNYYNRKKLFYSKEFIKNVHNKGYGIYL